MRRWVSLLCAGAALAWCCVPAVAAADEADPGQAAREIADARQRADDAARLYFDQESKLDALGTEQDELQVRIDATQREVDELEAKADEVALHRYVSSASAGIPLLDSFQSVDEAVQVRALINVVAAGTADDFDRYRVARAELDAQQSELDVKREEATGEQARLDQLRKDALAEVEHLKAVQADRLEDEAVRAALAAELAQRTRVQLQAAAAAGATTTTTVATVAGGANADRGSPTGGADGEAVDGPLPTTTTAPVGPTTSAVTTTTSPISGAGAVGGRATPVVVPAPAATAIGGVGGDYGSAGWVCPTGAAAVSFVDTWGAPRSGGRRHEGVDMIGSRGTPVLAVVAGVAVAKENVLGGMTVTITGADGNRYYYAHLDSYGTLGNVVAGTEIGKLGQTGNAVYSVPHLHFEIHPGGGQAVDPYPTARAHCLAPG